MNKRNHVTRQSVRKELCDNGFVTAFSSPGRPELWCKLGVRGKPVKEKQRYAVQRETRARSERWHIIPYPEPATCTPEQLPELTVRDGVVLNGDTGRIVPGQMTVESEFDWIDDNA